MQKAHRIAVRCAFCLEKTQLLTGKGSVLRLIISQKNLNGLVLLFRNDKQTYRAVRRQGSPQPSLVLFTASFPLHTRA